MGWAVGESRKKMQERKSVGEQGPLGVCGRGMEGAGRGAEYKAFSAPFTSQGV